jgi:hypothetical protein
VSREHPGSSLKRTRYPHLSRHFPAHNLTGAPLQGFRPFGIKASAKFEQKRLTFRNARFPIAPRLLGFLKLPQPADHRSWSATLRLARRSCKGFLPPPVQLQFASQEAPASGHRQSRPAGTQGRSARGKLRGFSWQPGINRFALAHSASPLGLRTADLPAIPAYGFAPALPPGLVRSQRCSLLSEPGPRVRAGSQVTTGWRHPPSIRC